LKQKEVKAQCKQFHDRQLEFRYQIMDYHKRNHTGKNSIPVIQSNPSSVPQQIITKSKSTGDTESHGKSSKESTISTLTKSNTSSDKPKEAQGTIHFRKSINGLFEYTSWLDNLNPLKEMEVTGVCNEKEKK